jgi:hypothetical protein
MRDQRITVTLFNGVIITLARTVPLTTTIIVKENNRTIETISALKQRQYGLFDVPTVLPVVAQPPFSF